MPSSIYQSIFRKEIPGYEVTRTTHHLDVKIKCKIERRKDTLVTQGPRDRYKGPKDKCSIGDNPPITALTSPCGGCKGKRDILIMCMKREAMRGTERREDEMRGGKRRI